ncbi:MAG: hydrogen gas-evolving membrane-bound hydrogenase subunit E [Bacilli bacterium]
MKKNNHLIDDKELLNSDDSIFEVNSEEDIAFKPKVMKRVKKDTQIISKVVYFAFAIVSGLAIVIALLTCLFYLPRFGETMNNPTLNDIYHEYIENGIDKTGATNFVTGMILDYRAFDTLGESFVLFTAVNCVLILLQEVKETKKKENEKYQPIKDPIVKFGCSLVVPLIFILGSYVILNGSISPGGGFSGGAIMGAGLILYSIAFGFENSQKFFKDKTFKAVSSIALLTYCASKTYSFLTGALEVESIVPLGIPGTILSGGIIFILNVAVGLVVTCTMFGLYSLFKKGEI